MSINKYFSLIIYKLTIPYYYKKRLKILVLFIYVANTHTIINKSIYIANYLQAIVMSISIK